MSDELEKRLERFYRGLDESAKRVEGRWRVQGRQGPPARPSLRLFWMIGGAVAAAALIVLSLRRPDPAPAPEPAGVEIARPAPRRTEPLPFPQPPPPPAPRPEEPRVAPPVPPPPTPEKPSPALPSPEIPKPVPAPAPPAPAPQEPRKPDPKPTVAERALATIRETEGTFDLADRNVRGKQKDLTVAAGDRLKASTVVKLTLSDDRFLLLSPKTVIEFRPEEKRLTVAIDLGDLHAELIGPGPDLRVTTRSCEVLPLGTVFTVRAEEKKSTVIVERGRVEVRSARGKAQARAGEGIQAAEDGALSAPAPADFRTLAWARPHRPAESTILLEDFTKPGAWKAEIDKGVARALPAPGAAAVIQLATDKPLFDVPVRGQVQVVYRADRASKMYVQFFVRDVRLNFRKEVPVLKTPTWRTLTLDIEEFAVMDKSKAAGRPPAGLGVYDFGLFYGEDGEKGNFWVDSIKVVEVRP